jgi:hypothetical protein
MSKINFVTVKQFQKVINQAQEFGLRGKEVLNPKNIMTKDSYTDGVRTCTTMFLVDGKHHNKYIGCHVWDNTTKQELDEFFKQIPEGKFTKALVIGGKEVSDVPRSLLIFDTILKNIQAKCKDVSFFRKHTNKLGETAIEYSPKTDTFTICPKNVHNRWVEGAKVTKDYFLDFYEKIKLSPKDELFIENIHL